MLNIEKAYYGSYVGPAKDVTASVKAGAANLQPSDTTFKIHIYPTTFGLPGDFQNLISKSFTVFFSYGNKQDRLILSKTGVDFEDINIPVVPNLYIINNAVYGGGNVVVDITEQMQRAILSELDALAFTVGSSDFLQRFVQGNYDWAGITNRVLYLNYTSGTTTNDVIAHDNQSVNLATI
jgi:hypothetical protein